MTIDNLIQDLHEQARAVEMEANGFVAACAEVSVPWLILEAFLISEILANLN